MSAASTEPLLSVRDLRVCFNSDAGVVKAADGVSFDVRPGEVLGLVGESGSGKTVVSLATMGLIPQPPGFIPSGQILFDGQDLLRLSEAEQRSLRGRRIAMIFQDPMTALNPYLTVGLQLAEVLETHRNLKRAEARTLSAAMLARVGIPDAERRLDAYPHELSGGMRQRVMIAMALL
ncbi:MAG TPA: ABC transporter ATP-binding protein, partial [Polyangiales bacterium]|nr:ABC transporter ATP-binding protein [Polyangiales bacterium]